MKPLAEVGNLIEVTPWDDLQFWADENSGWTLVEDRVPFRFLVAGHLRDQGKFFGLYGPVQSGPDRYLGLVCNVMLRFDESNWFRSSMCGAGFKVGPSVARRVASYHQVEHDDVPFYLHPEGTFVDGFPRMSRIAGVEVVRRV